ncbi:MAG: MBL fold metallo-hydrolase [Methanomassiliicoccaceae archaeon]|nr:MBL fold metallo-hydrolase [Methanomassiliicoccaceae archaeon]
MQAKITSVYDEGSQVGTSLIGAKGFSALIESGGQRVLFDTGRRGRYLLHNMAFLDIRPEDIDKVVISHLHASHTGGVEDLLRGRGAPLGIYAPRPAAGAKGQKGVRIPEGLSDRASVFEVMDWMQVADKVFVSCPTDAGGGLSEVFMVILSRKGPAVVAACSHAGVDAVMELVNKRFGTYPHAYVGGVHIRKGEREKAARIAASFAEKKCTDLHLNHCTGVDGMMYLRMELGLRGVSDFYAGSSLSLDL